MIYFRLNDLIQLNRTSIQAYSKLQKLFEPDNKENKASDVMHSVFLLRKYYTLYNIEEMKQTMVNKDDINKKRRTILDFEIIRLRQKNIFVLRANKLQFLRVKFVFFLKFFTDFNNYIDDFKTSRKHPINISSMFQNLESKLDGNLESMSVKLASINSIDSIIERLKTNDNILLRKIEKIKKYNNSLIVYLIDLVNSQINCNPKKKREFQTKILKRLSLKRSKTKMEFNFKSCKSLKDP